MNQNRILNSLLKNNKKMAVILMLFFILVTVLIYIFERNYLIFQTNPTDKQTLHHQINDNVDVRRIALIGSSKAISTAFDSFEKKLSELSKNDGSMTFEFVKIEVPFSKINIENAVEYVKMHDKADLIVTGQSDLQYIIPLVKDIPIISVISSDPVALGYARSEDGSGTNVVFIDSGTIRNSKKRLEIFLDLVPNTKKLLVIRGDKKLFQENDLAINLMREEILKEGLDIELVEKTFSNRNDFNRFMLEYDFRDIDGIIRYPGIFGATNIDLFFTFQEKIKKPVIVLNKQEVEMGGLISYGPINEELGKTGAFSAWQILKGQISPGEIPILRPFKNELVINETVANSLNIKIPDSVKKMVDVYVK